MSLVGITGLVLGVGVAGCIALSWLLVAASEARHEWAIRREHVRADRAYYAAIEAAEDDPSFAPDVVRQSIGQIVALANRLWRGRSDTALEGRADESLIRAWARSRQSWLGSGLRLRGTPSIDLLRVVNRADDREDRVVARVRVRLYRNRPLLDLLAARRIRLDERWTLGRYDGQWALLSVEGDPLAGPVLTAPLIPTPAYDTERLREESFAELGSAQKVPDGVALSDLVGADEPAAFALLDLSLVDGRFVPDLVAAQLAHLVEAWEEAVTGSLAPLEALAGQEVVTALLEPMPGKRLLIRDAVMKSWVAQRLELSKQPPSIEVQLDVEAFRYVVADDGTHRAGNDDVRRRIVLTWTLELTDSRIPWRLVKSANPAEDIPGWSSP